MLDPVATLPPVREHKAFWEPLKAKLERLAPTALSVLLRGPTGSGKGDVARDIAELAGYKPAKVVYFNVAAVAPSMQVAEACGWVKGAFTDAHKPRKGKFRAAAGGMIFLDEIGAASKAMQLALQSLFDGTVQPVGDDKTYDVQCRIVMATSANLEALEASGDFMPDLIGRMQTVQLWVWSLHERANDIPPLAHHIVDLVVEHYRKASRNRSYHASLTPRAIDWLQTLRYPYNVRSLKSLLVQATLFGPAGPRCVEQLEPIANELGIRPVGQVGQVGQVLANPQVYENLGNLKKAGQGLANLASFWPTPGQPSLEDICAQLGTYTLAEVRKHCSLPRRSLSRALKVHARDGLATVVESGAGKATVYRWVDPKIG